MNKFQYTLLAGLAVAFVFIFFYTFNDTDVEDNYVRELRKSREKKDKDFKYAEWSPLTEDQRRRFTNLDYFEPNPSYRIIAKVNVLHNDTVFKYMTSGNEIRRFYKYASLSFEMDKKQCSLILLKSAEATTPNYYFLPFKDLTTGKATYGAGRYIDVEAPKTTTMEIDFNKAYNPYCAYNESYSCPFPPDENQLPINIFAGERVFSQPELTDTDK